MDCHFLTYHGTLLCFGRDGADFRHVALDALDDALLVTSDACCDALRRGALAGHPMAIRADRPARIGLPRALGIDRGVRPGTISLVWRDAHLCADGNGGTIRSSAQVDAWEEFLPVQKADVAVLRALDHLGWEWDRNGKRFDAGQIRPGEDFMLRAGELRVPLNKVASLGGSQALRDGRVSLLEDGWRIETLRRYDPLVVWRHDGSKGADEEIVLGLSSMITSAGQGFRLMIETRLDRAELLRRVPGLDQFAFAVEPPDERAGLLPWPTGIDGAPILQLGNGVICRGPLGRVLRALLDEREIALMPWVWTPFDAPDAQSLFWGEDPVEDETAVGCSNSIIGVPNGERAALFGSLITTIARNRLDGVDVDDAIERDLLRYVMARVGGGTTRLFARHAADANGEWGLRSLVDFRSVPAAIRQDAMRRAIGPAA